MSSDYYFVTKFTESDILECFAPGSESLESEFVFENMYSIKSYIFFSKTYFEV